MAKIYVKEALLCQSVKKRSLQKRDMMEVVRNRSGFLESKDRILLKTYMDSGCSLAEIGRLLGVSEANICRRINKIIKRLAEADKIFYLRDSQRFSFFEQAVGMDYHIAGLSQSDIAKKRDCSLYRVKKILKEIRCFLNEQQVQGLNRVSKRERDRIREKRYEANCRC